MFMKDKQIKVLFISRATLFDSPGGDTIQILKTAEGLRSLNVLVDIGLTGDNFNYDQYDIVHFFNIIRPADILYHFKRAKKTVISTIFVDYSESDLKAGTFFRSLINRCLGGDITEYLKSITKHILGKEKIRSNSFVYKGHYNSIKYLYKNADALLPNSNNEYFRLQKKYGFTQSYVQKIVNSIEVIDTIVPNLKFNNSIICVGRIERLKNQLSLIKAVNELEIPCYIIGKPAINDLKYFELCKKEAGKNIFFMEMLPQNEIFSIMKAAKVHALPSWFETTGLVSLEAAYYGCNIVVTKKGDQEEYFREYAYYCDPENINSIKNAIITAYNSSYNENFKNYIKNHYNWSKTALQTKQVYMRVLNL